MRVCEVLENLSIIAVSLEQRVQSEIVKNGGGIAQLGERLHGMQEVSGSIPLTSTKNLTVRGGAQFKEEGLSPLRLEA